LEGKIMATSHDHKAGGQSSNVHGNGGAAKTAPETMASSAAQQVENAAHYVGQRAEDATSAVGSQMRNLGSSIREHAPDRGVFGKTSAALAESLEGGGRYLEQHGLHGIGKDLTTLIQRNPIPAVLVGCGLGFMLARATRR
jgi:hypothetical protein